MTITQNIINNWVKGDDPDIQQIAKEEEENVYAMFQQCVEEEKAWAEYLFKDGSIIGLNDKLLAKYVEWTANRRLKSIGLKAIFDTPISNNPLPWTSTGYLLKVCKLLLKRQKLSHISSVVSNKMLRKTHLQDLNYEPN